MSSTPLRAAACLAALAALSGATAGAQATALPTPAPAGPVASAPAGRAHLHALPPATRIRLVTPDLPEKQFIGTLVRIDSAPSLTYVVESGQATWSVPRSAVVAAAQRVGTVSHRRAVWKVALVSVAAGAASAYLWESARDDGEKRYGPTMAKHIAGATLIGMSIGRQAATERWADLELPER